MRVRPANPAAVIRDPRTKRPLPADGGDVPETNYWIRKLAAGDVVLVSGAPVAPEYAPIPPLATRDGDAR